MTGAGVRPRNALSTPYFLRVRVVRCALTGATLRLKEQQAAAAQGKLLPRKTVASVIRRAAYNLVVHKWAKVTASLVLPACVRDYIARQYPDADSPLYADTMPNSDGPWAPLHLRAFWPYIGKYLLTADRQLAFKPLLGPFARTSPTRSHAARAL